MSKNLTITLGHDSDVENPLEWTDWKLYSFNRRHINFRHPDEFFPPGIGLRRKLDAGTAFVLSYYGHGNCVWSLQGEGPKCPWDTTRTAGILIWEGKPKRIGADRREAARNILKEYTLWCNGECYYYTILDEDTGEYLDNMGSCIGTDMLWECLSQQLKPGDRVTFEGECDWIADHKALPEGVKLAEDLVEA